MCDYLQELFELELSSRRLDLGRIPNTADCLRHLDACYDEIHAKMGLEFLDRLSDLESEESYNERLACFCHGFHLAVRLIMG